MPEWFIEGGFFMWPLLLIALWIAVLAVRATLLLSSGGPDARAEVESRVQGILFWGTIAAGLGMLATLGGISQMATAIALAGDMGPSLVWGGIGVALVTSLFGLLILLAAAVLWFTLRQWHHRRLRTATLAA